MTKINPLIFRAYDIRGIAMPDAGAKTDAGATQNGGAKADLSPETIRLIGLGTGTYLKRKYGARNMIVGRDNRLHGESLQKAFIEGALSSGLDVIDTGLCTSPLIYYAVCRFGADSGINITASHNPKEYNGVKIVGRDAHSVCGDELREILDIIERGDFEKGAGKLTKRNDIFDIYLEDIKKRIKPGRRLKVVVDAGNGTAGLFAPELLRGIGCDVTELYCELDGNFPNHEANPEEEKNMRDLAAAVVKEKADLGIGFDGDGDRVGVVDENGKHYSADWILILLARELLAARQKSQIIFDVKVSRILMDEISRLGGIPVMSKTGHTFIEARMRELGSPLAGEISGHLFFGKDFYDYYGFDDAFLAACKIVEIVSKSDLKFSEHFLDLPKMETTPEFKARCPDEKKFRIVAELADNFRKRYPCVTIDGVRVNFDEKSWGAVRCSNTSPNLTLRFEAPTKERLLEIQEIMVEELKKYPEIDLNWYRSGQSTQTEGLSLNKRGNT